MRAISPTSASKPPGSGRLSRSGFVLGPGAHSPVRRPGGVRAAEANPVYWLSLLAIEPAPAPLSVPIATRYLDAPISESPLKRRHRPLLAPGAVERSTPGRASRDALVELGSRRPDRTLRERIADRCVANIQTTASSDRVGGCRRLPPDTRQITGPRP